MSTETENRENLKGDADRYICAILTQITTAMKTLDNVHDYQANIGATLCKSTAVHAPASELADYVKPMLVQTRNLKTRATLIHENTLKLDHTLIQLEMLEKEEANKCETR